MRGLMLLGFLFLAIGCGDPAPNADLGRDMTVDAGKTDTETPTDTGKTDLTSDMQLSPDIGPTFTLDEVRQQQASPVGAELRGDQLLTFQPGDHRPQFLVWERNPFDEFEIVDFAYIPEDAVSFAMNEDHAYLLAERANVEIAGGLETILVTFEFGPELRKTGEVILSTPEDPRCNAAPGDGFGFHWIAGAGDDVLVQCSSTIAVVDVSSEPRLTGKSWAPSLPGGRIGGLISRSLSTGDTELFLNTGDRLFSLRFAAGRLQEQGSLSIERRGVTQSVFLSDDLLILIRGGIEIYDVSDPMAMQLLGGLHNDAPPSTRGGSALKDNLLFWPARQDLKRFLKIIDISDPTSPGEVAVMDDFSVEDMVVMGDQLISTHLDDPPIRTHDIESLLSPQ